MSDSIKDRVTADLQKAQKEERIRSARVQQIIKNAFLEAVSEVKQGSSEIRLIAKDTLSAMAKKLDIQGIKTAETAAEPMNPASAEIKTRTVLNAIKNRLAAYLQQEYATLSNQSIGLRDRLSPLQTRLTERYGDRFTEIKHRVAVLDAKLDARYGDRYGVAKQRLENFKLWYSSTLVQAETISPGLLQQKQAEFEGEVVANAGVSLAKREQRIKQQVKQFLQTTVARF